MTDVLKGNQTGQVELSYMAQWEDMGIEQAMIGSRILAFGKLSDSGQAYELVPMSSGSRVALRHLVLSVGSPLAVPAIAINVKDTPLQKVIKELGMIQMGQGGDGAAVYLSTVMQARVEPEVSETVFRAIRDSGPRGLTLGTAGLVALGGISGLESADSLEIQGHPELSSIVLSIERSYSDTSQASLQILARWLGPSMPAVKRQAAAGALARVHTASAILQLGNLLNDSDFEVRWRAIGGLSMFANNVSVGSANLSPGPASFRTADTIEFSIFDRNLKELGEDKYLRFWRSWWDQNQGRIQTLAETEVR